MKLFECIPLNIADSLQKAGDIRELRIRDGSAVKMNVGGRWYYLGKNNALVSAPHLAITVGKVCDDIVKKACHNSVYAYEKTLANGFFTLEDGVRVGVCGQVFGADRNIFQSYTSLCFRIPHHVNCVGTELVKRCVKKNILVLGAPGAGKTTYLRDLSVKLGQSNNVLVVDERGELFYDEYLMSISGCDVLKWATKSYAFEVGVRAMSPNYIVCDELAESDIDFVKSCINSGVNLVCSAHGHCKEDFDQRFGLLDCFDIVVDLNVNKDDVQLLHVT